MIIFSTPFIVCPLDNKEKIWGWQGIPKFYLKKKKNPAKAYAEDDAAWDT